MERKTSTRMVNRLRVTTINYFFTQEEYDLIRAKNRRIAGNIHDEIKQTDTGSVTIYKIGLTEDTPMADQLEKIIKECGFEQSNNTSHPNFPKVEVE